MSWQPCPLPQNSQPGKLKINVGVDHTVGSETVEALRIFDLDPPGTRRKHSV